MKGTKLTKINEMPSYFDSRLFSFQNLACDTLMENF